VPAKRCTLSADRRLRSIASRVSNNYATQNMAIMRNKRRAGGAIVASLTSSNHPQNLQE
jgi:hypothetical protein